MISAQQQQQLLENNKRLEANIKKLKSGILASNQALIKDPVWNWQEAALEIQYVLCFIGKYIELSPLMLLKIQQWSQGHGADDGTKSFAIDENQSERLVLNLYDVAKVALELKKIIKDHPEQNPRFEPILKKLLINLEKFETDCVSQTNDIKGLLQEQKRILVTPVFSDFINAYLEMSYEQLLGCAPVLKLSTSQWKNFKEWYTTILFTSSEWNINAYHKIKHHFYNLYLLAKATQDHPELTVIAKFKQIMQLPNDIGIRLLFANNFNFKTLEANINGENVWKNLKPASQTPPSDGIYANPHLVPKSWTQAVVNLNKEGK